MNQGEFDINRARFSSPDSGVPLRRASERRLRGGALHGDEGACNGTEIDNSSAGGGQRRQHRARHCRIGPRPFTCVACMCSRSFHSRSLSYVCVVCGRPSISTVDDPLSESFLDIHMCGACGPLLFFFFWLKNDTIGPSLGFFVEM